MPYKCYICDRTFKKPEFLGVHSAMHTAADLDPKLLPSTKKKPDEDLLQQLAEKLMALTKQTEKPKLEKTVSERKFVKQDIKRPRAKFVRSFSTPIRVPPRPNEPPPSHLLRKRRQGF